MKIPFGRKEALGVVLLVLLAIATGFAASNAGVISFAPGAPNPGHEASGVGPGIFKGDATDVYTFLGTVEAADFSCTDCIGATEVDGTMQERVTDNCNGQVMVGINADGTVSCEADDTGAGGDGDWTINGNDMESAVSGNVGIGIVPGEKLDVAGTVRATAFMYSSDGRLKKNVQKIPNALEKTLKLNGVLFEWIENDEQSIGLIAQDAEEVIPELVSTGNNDGLKSVQYGNIVALLIEAIKEQQMQIDALTAEIEELKKIAND